MNVAASRLEAAFFGKRHKIAVVAQLVEHFHGKEGVSGPIPDNGSRKSKFPPFGGFVLGTDILHSGQRLVWR